MLADNHDFFWVYVKLSIFPFLSHCIYLHWISTCIVFPWHSTIAKVLLQLFTINLHLYYPEQCKYPQHISLRQNCLFVANADFRSPLDILETKETPGLWSSSPEDPYGCSILPEVCSEEKSVKARTAHSLEYSYLRGKEFHTVLTSPVFRRLK